MLTDDLWKRGIFFRVLDSHRLCRIRMSPRQVMKVRSISNYCFMQCPCWRATIESDASCSEFWIRTDFVEVGCHHARLWKFEVSVLFYSIPMLTDDLGKQYIVLRVLDSHQLCRIPMERLQVITFWSIGIVFHVEWRPSKAIDLVESLGPAPT